jgi:2-dehydropantoate 2-reductase
LYEINAGYILIRFPFEKKVIFDMACSYSKEAEMEKARLLIIGAGVNGSAMAVRLFSHGVDVKVLTRGQRVDFLREEGIIIENPFNHKRSVTRVPVIDRIDPEDLYDYIFVVIRKNEVLDSLRVLARNKSANIVFIGNNLSGPDEFTKIIDPGRIMLGTPIAAGKRDGQIIRAITNLPAASLYGELDGRITPRLKRLVKILNEGGIRAKVSAELIDHQSTHAAEVALIATLVMKHGCDLVALARSRQDLYAFVQARQEAMEVLKDVGRKIVPHSNENLRYIPAFLQVAVMQALLKSRFVEVGLAYHVSQAPDEIRQLATELRLLADRSGRTVPAIRHIVGVEENGLSANKAGEEGQPSLKR